jgi:hypothetical protein
VAGPAPSRAAVEQRADWEAAWRALGRTGEYRLHAAATKGQLLNTVLVWHRIEATAPPNVDEEMRATARTADYCDREARHLQAAGDVADPTVAQTVASFRAAEAQARRRLAQLEQAAAERAAWRSSTDSQRRAAAMARTELDRRVTYPEIGTVEQAPDVNPDQTEARMTSHGHDVGRDLLDRDGYDETHVRTPEPGIEI